MPSSRVGARAAARLPSNLCPPVDVNDETLTLMPHLAAAIDKRLLRRPTLSPAHRVHEINAVLDAVTSGI